MVAVSQWILGVRPEHAGLRVEPIVPRSWAGFRATRRFRGTTYEIEVRRDGQDGSGVGSSDLADSQVSGSAGGAEPPGAVRVVVDGRPTDGTVIPLPEPGTPLVRVEVSLS
jgi:cellobiose phosphorylase